MKTKLKISKLFRRRENKLRATTLRRQLRTAATVKDYEEMAEPNMKLSRALLIVLLLHVVAVAGIIAFNAIKTRQGSFAHVPAPAASTVNSNATSTTKPSAVAPPAATAQKGSAKPVTKDSSKIERAKQTESVKGATDSGKVYVVAKGDNPVTIAKKFKVPYDDLIALNHIDDPRKLKIGQKLLIPTKTDKPKKPAE
jgi:LysM repeat protein